MHSSFRPGDPNWNRYHRINHPGTFNANPLSAAAGVAMLKEAATGEPQKYVERMGRKLTIALNEAIWASALRAVVSMATARYGM